MVYAPRKIVYPLFVIIFSLVFFSMLFLAFFNQSIDVLDPSVSVSGTDVVIKLTLVNNSMHAIDGVRVVVSSESEEKAFFLRGSNDSQKSSLAAGEKFDFVATFPVTQTLKYKVVISAPFNKPVPIDFTLEQSTIDPVRAEVSLPAKLYVNEKLEYPVKLCNISGTDLPEVIWVENAEGGDFKETFFERSVSLKVSECKTIFSIITPQKTGNINLGFSLKVGALEKKILTVLNVVAK